jgi:hypothetical protein
MRCFSGKNQHDALDECTFLRDVSISGELVSVAGTDLDFQTPHQLGPLIQKRGGYDNNYCVNIDGLTNPVFVSR